MRAYAVLCGVQPHAPRTGERWFYEEYSNSPSGYATDSSAVMRASGKLHTSGMTRKPSRARPAPPALKWR